METQLQVAMLRLNVGPIREEESFYVSSDGVGMARDVDRGV
jgi:hypothetical protein